MKNRFEHGWVAGICGALLVAGCAPTVQLSTPEPIKVDVNMKVDVTTQDAGKKAGAATVDEDATTPEERRRNRMAEVQALKNDQVIGEGNDYMLVIRNAPADPAYLDYVKKVVAAENADRQEILQARATQEKKPLSVIVKEAARKAREIAFPGEWIQQEDGTWVQR